MDSDDYRTNDGSTDWEEILTFDPESLKPEQHAALKRRAQEKVEEGYAEHVQGIRDSFTNAPDDDDEFMERFVDPKE